MASIELQELQEYLSQWGAFLDGKEMGCHFKLPRSGLHVTRLYRIAVALEHRAVAEWLSRRLMTAIYQARFLQTSYGMRSPTSEENPLILLAPSFSGIPLAYYLAPRIPVPSVRVILLPRIGSGLPGFSRSLKNRIPTDSRAIFVDDIIGGGRTLQYVVKEFPGTVVGAAVCVSRMATDAGVPVAALAEDLNASYDPSTCPLCLVKVPLRKRV